MIQRQQYAILQEELKALKESLLFGYFVESIAKSYVDRYVHVLSVRDARYSELYTPRRGHVSANHILIYYESHSYMCALFPGVWAFHS